MWLMGVGGQTNGWDFTPYQNHGAFSGAAPPTWAVVSDGQWGTDLPGATGFVDITSTTRFDNASGTIAFWFQHDVIATTLDGVCHRATATTGRNGFSLWAENIAGSDYLLYETQDGAGKVCNSSDSGAAPFPILTIGRWHHVAFAWSQASGGTNRIYLDGVEFTGSTLTNSAAWTFNSQNFQIGNPFNGFTEYFDGKWHSLLWYARNLTPGEVRLLSLGASPQTLRRRSVAKAPAVGGTAVPVFYRHLQTQGIA